MHAGQRDVSTMILHTCPVCERVHEVREARAELAYGRQLTCSPDCESVRRGRMRHRPFRPVAAIEPSASDGDGIAALHAAHE